MNCCVAKGAKGAKDAADAVSGTMAPVVMSVPAGMCQKFHGYRCLGCQASSLCSRAARQGRRILNKWADSGTPQKKVNPTQVSDQMGHPVDEGGVKDHNFKTQD